MEDLSPLSSLLPNEFSKGMGRRIRHARTLRGISQVDLAKRIHRRQAALSEMENGKMQVDASTLVALAVVLHMPVIYFFPEPWSSHIAVDNLDAEDIEVLDAFHQLTSRDLRRTAMYQLQILYDLQTNLPGE